jgi:pseudouridylate synthase
LLQLQPEVAAALADGRPVVALESTIISHGMPWPQNVETAHAVEAEVRGHGAVPATIAVIDGRLQAGLSAAQIERLGRAGPAVTKASRRDLPFLLAGCAQRPGGGGGPAGARRAEGGDALGLGATTVAATMIVAALAGIRVFATGGIGGVHRGAEASFDISADLPELARSEVAVVCAGPKSILDIALTLEYLETHGVPVIGFGSAELPAFYSRESGFAVDYRLDDPADIARVMRAKWALGSGRGDQGGLVIANPIPVAFALPREAIDGAIHQALVDAARLGIGGKAVTPFLLDRVNQLTGGLSLAANIQLVLNNARLAAAVAVAYAALSAKA